MKIGVLLFVVSDIKDYLVTKSLLHTDGSFGDFDPTTDAMLASVIDTSLKEHGVDVPDQVDKIIAALPLLLSLVL